MNSDTNSNFEKKSAREIKGEVMNDIRKLNRDIEQLKDHLTPGQVIDDVLFYRVQRTPRASFDYLRANPIGSSFLALGTILLMEDDQQRSFESIARSRSSGAIESARGRIDATRSSYSDLRGKVEEKISTLKSKLPQRKDASGADIYDESFSGTYGVGTEFGVAEGRSETYEEVKEKFSEKADELKGKVQDLRDRATEKIDASGKIEETKSRLSSAVDSVRGKIPGLKDRASESFDSAKTRISSTIGAVRESVGEYDPNRAMQPLTYIALGAGLGALTGSTLPMVETETERSINDEFGSKFSNFNQDLQAALNESASILKTEFFNDLAGLDFRLFGGGGNESRV